ncbi:Zinc finger protein castor 1 [Mactra antiquata]
MALTVGRKLCKLDAICAKLQQINNKERSSSDDKEEKDEDTEHTESKVESPVDLTSKCYNNNIIGKADLNTVETDETQNGLDLSMKPNGNNSNDSDKNDELASPSKGSPIDLKSSNNGNHKVADESGSQIRSVVGSGRRKRAIPRSIPQNNDIYEHSEKKFLNYSEIHMKEFNDREQSLKRISGNSLSGSFESTINEDSDSSMLNHSRTSAQSKDSQKSRSSSDVNFSAPLDLSMNRSREDDDSINSYLSTDDDDDHIEDNIDDNSDDDDDDFFHPDRNMGASVNNEKGSKLGNSGSVTSASNSRQVGSEQADHLKDYAESTMNELISMYGFGGSGTSQHDLSKHVPLRNFKTILQQAHKEPAVHSPSGSTSMSSLHSQMSSGEEESHDGSMMSLKGMYANYGGHPQKGQGKHNDRFTSSSSFINAVYNTNMGPNTGQISPALPNYSKYLKRYNSGSECGGQHCKDLGYREHYHCIDCSFQVFVKKEEMVRHYKWHRKREESLQHGFLRFSPLDNCTKRFGHCTHNGKQTHYHCLQNGCDKVYISTSDVQMHANYHRKDSAIMSEGFQRFRATEDCGTLACAFYGQRTTHFHCLRPDCKFTFKNKADMEKHKSYHQKDEVLGRDGFKKFMKYEHCMYHGCRYSKVSNHIHCIRSGCDYVLHSTAQLYSHKRKHERRDFESAYKKYRDKAVNKQILPRNDFGSMQQVASLTGSPIIAALPGVMNIQVGLKRHMELDNTEPLELKKPKVEPGSDVESIAASNQSARSTPTERLKVKPDPDEMDMEASSDLEDSNEEKHEDLKNLRQTFGDGENLKLSGSLTLPIPMFKGLTKNEKTNLSPVTSPTLSVQQQQQQQPTTSMNPLEKLQNSGPLFTAIPSVSSSMPSTLSGMNFGSLLSMSSTFPGPATALQPPKSVYTERREKDDSWKNYLVRYTANDPCNPRCQYLYKDHYHCKMDGCLVLFKSKDGVREHARFHELQECITPIAYTTYEENESCTENCQYNEKQKHYHCIWTGCSHVVPYIGPTFGRLEHYRIHEYARAAAGKSYGRSGRGLNNMDDSSMRRRGRPPKYPKLDLPKIPKVELTDEEIQMSHVPAQETEVNDKVKVINGFRVFSPDDPCPDERCNFVGKLHYHCARPRCFTITDRIDVLNLHAKDFHSFVKILEGYEFFDRNVSCRRMHCPNNQTNRHFHCSRPKCDYSFIRHSTMSQHEKKHQASNGSNGTDPTSPRAVVRDIPLLPVGSIGSPTNVQPTTNMSSVTSVITSNTAFLPVKSSQTGLPIFIPQSGTITSLPQGQVIISPQPINLVGGNAKTPINVSSIPISAVQALPASVSATTLVTGLPAPLVTNDGNLSVSAAVNTANGSNASVPLTVLLQRGLNPVPLPTWNEIKQKMHFAISQNCGRPFCKLKKKDHYHCRECNQAFSDPARLRSHIGKHGIKLKGTEPENTVIKHVSQLGTIGFQRSDVNVVDKIENQDMDPDEVQCLTEGGDMPQDDSDVEDTKSSSLNLNPSTFSEMISKAQEQNKISSDDSDDDGENCLHIDIVPEADVNGNMSDSNEQRADISSRSGRKIIKTKKEDFMNSGDINLNKQRQSSVPKPITKQAPTKPSNGHSSKLAFGGTRGLRDDSIPEGYSRWRYNEECKYSRCAYKHSVTHFHCIRDDCGYGFSDRSRLVQHTLRHERIDSITGGELQQYRINQDCENNNCEYNKKMSHFHCKRCTYSCTDSSKVLTHRKHHAKMDNISNQGFEKFFAADDCAISLCPYSRKQSHFHCLVDTCRAAVLGPVQMTSHKAKHGN